MNRSSDPNATDPFAWSAEHLRRLVALTSEAVSSIFSNGASSRIAPGRGAAAHQVMRNAKSQADITLPSSSTPFRESATVSWLTAKSADHSMPALEPSVTNVTNVTTVNANWSQQVGAAKLAWNRLSESELLKSEGNEHKLAVMVEEHYFISNAEASKRVRTFLGKQTSWCAIPDIHAAKRGASDHG